MEKIGYKQLDEMMKKCDRTQVVSVHMENGDRFDVEIKRYLTTVEKAQLCARVVAQVFADGEYNPYVKRDVIKAALIEYFTNIKADNLTPERLGWLTGYTEIIAQIRYCANSCVVDVEETIHAAIEAKNAEIREKRARDIDALMDTVKALIDKFNVIGESLGNMDIQGLVGDIKKIADADDEQRVRNVLAVKKELSDGNT
nr:MAG TPA: hypothetical protein [Caudoviricetes sp.]